MAIKVDPIKVKIDSGEISYMYEIVTDICMKYSDGKLCDFENFDKVFSKFLLCRYLSMRKSFIEYSNYLNILNSKDILDNKQFYKLAYNLIPKQSNAFIKYIKKAAKSKELNKDEQINNFNSDTNQLYDI